jgi:hypothetical protein
MKNVQQKKTKPTKSSATPGPKDIEEALNFLGTVVDELEDALVSIAKAESIRLHEGEEEFAVGECAKARVAICEAIKHAAHIPGFLGTGAES